jgi:hypothetical protein
MKTSAGMPGLSFSSPSFQLIGRQPQPHGIGRWRIPRFLAGVGRDMNDLGLGLHGVALVEGGEADDGALALARPRRCPGRTRASITNSSVSGTMRMIVSPGPITPPMVCTESSWTRPARGARIDVRASLVALQVPALLQLGDAAFRLAQLLQRRWSAHRLELDDLEPGLADAPGPARLLPRAGRVAVQPRLLALQPAPG